jgi:hypothetical protein
LQGSFHYWRDRQPPRPAIIRQNRREQKEAVGETCPKRRQSDTLAQVAPVLSFWILPGSDEGEPDIVELIVVESASAILRWLHVIAGIAWIGSSFYFIHLDLSLKPRPGLPAGVKGDEW